MNTGQWAVLYGRGGNHRSGIALTMHHRLCGISSDGFNGFKNRDKHATYASVRV